MRTPGNPTVGGSRSLRAKVLLWLALLFPAASEAQPGIAGIPVNVFVVGGWRWLVVSFLCLVVGPSCCRVVDLVVWPVSVRR